MDHPRQDPRPARRRRILPRFSLFGALLLLVAGALFVRGRLEARRLDSEATEAGSFIARVDCASPAAFAAHLSELDPALTLLQTLDAWHARGPPLRLRLGFVSMEIPRRRLQDAYIA